VPGTSLPAVGARIMGLDDPEQKMSKSETAPPTTRVSRCSTARQKSARPLCAATTDSKPGGGFSKRPARGVRNLLLHRTRALFSGAADEEMKARFTGMRYGDLKERSGRYGHRPA